LKTVRAREGDFIETSDGLIFDVKGVLHPPARVIAYVRYLPDRRGTRERAGVRYRKVYDLTARAKLLKEKWPHYLHRDPVFHRVVQAVPFNNVKRHYIPTERFTELLGGSELDEQERMAGDMGEILANEAGISTMKIGVSGSTLVGLHTPESDIDLIIYGTEAAQRCHSKLGALLSTRSRGFSPHDTKDLRELYRQRRLEAAMSFEAFARHERGKFLQGKFRGKFYFVRCVKEWDELQEAYGDREYYSVGRMSLRATIVDDSESILTPCTYGVTDAELRGRRLRHVPTQIVSFRGRFCEQARRGDRIFAKGNLERIIDERGETYRLVIGEDPRDCLMLVERDE